MKIAIGQMISNEHRYLNEWLRYHLKHIGIDHIFLYEDVLSRSHKEMCDQFDNVTLYNIEDKLSDELKYKVAYKNMFIQTAVLYDLMHSLKDEYDWLLFIDVDEFISGDPHVTAERYKDAPVISMFNYAMTCADILDDPPYEYSVVEKYTTRTVYFSGQFKCLINLKHPIFDDLDNFSFKWVPHAITNDDLLIHDNEVHHYLFKTWPEYVDRLLNKGFMSDSEWNRKLENFFDLNRHLRSVKDHLISKVYIENPDFKINVENQYARRDIFKKCLKGIDIDWKQKVDHIYCLHYVKHTERLDYLIEELKRVDIYDSEIFTMYNVDDLGMFDNKVHEATYNHCQIMEDALSKGYEKILILENDVRFLKNINVLKAKIADIPDNADIVQLDYVFGYYHNEVIRINDIRYQSDNLGKSFIDVSKYDKVYSAAAYIVDQKAIRYLIANAKHNKYRCAPDQYIARNEKTVDLNIDKELIRYVPTYNIAVQETFKTNLRTKLRGFDNCYTRYIWQGININNYKLYQPLNYIQSNFYI